MQKDDVIYRQAAINGLWSLDVELRPSAIDAILNMLNGLPPIQRWIPCDQKLPSNDKPVLLTAELWFPDNSRRRDVCMASYDLQNKTWYEILGANILEIPHPIAWMELPEPQQDE